MLWLPVSPDFSFTKAIRVCRSWKRRGLWLVLGGREREREREREEINRHTYM